MHAEWGKVIADFEDVLFPQLSLDPWERTLYLHLVRHTRLKGVSSGLFAIGPLSKVLSISDFKVREVLRSLHTKSCIRIEDRSRNGHLIHVMLPTEIPVLTWSEPEVTNVDLESLDFFSGRRYVVPLMARENYACFYCLRTLTTDTCELDHLVPQIEKIDNSYKNVVASCHNCNKAKGSQSAVAFLRAKYRASLLSEEDLQNRISTLDAIQNGTLAPDIRTDD